MPLVVQEPPPPAFQLPLEAITCLEESGCLVDPDPVACAALACDPAPAVISCGETDLVPNCLACTLTPDCSDMSCTPVNSFAVVDLVPDACPDLLAGNP